MLQCGISPDYVLDKMKFYEIECIIDNMWRKDKVSWEQTRAMAYATGIKKVDMTFPWEKSGVNDIPTLEEREELMKEMKAMEEKMNKK